MPFKTDNKKLGSPFLKRSVKLLPCQKEMILFWYNEKGLSIHKLAKMFKVDRRLIQFILFPERLEANKQKRLERGGTKQYYKKEYHTEKIREHRRYKYSVLK